MVDVSEAGGGTGYVLVHRAVTPLFQPLKIMNPVTYLGRLPGNDVVLASENVSRRHAKLIVTDLGVTVHDLDSHNGVFLNGKKVRSTPVAPGDLLYVGDMCVELQRGVIATPAGAGGYDGSSHTSVVHNDISGEDDPRARSLAAIIRVADLCGGGGDDSWAVDAIQICRELVEATTAVLVEVHSDGELATPVMLQAEASGSAPVLWPVVRRAIDSQRSVFADDGDRTATTGTDASEKGAPGKGAPGKGAPGNDAPGKDARATMAVPVLVHDGSAALVGAVIYLSRAQASAVFSNTELETLNAIAHLIGLRLERSRRPAGATNAGDDDIDAIVVAAQAKLAAAEELIAAEQQEVQVLTERVHNLEGENLKLRQQSDLERQGAQKHVAEKEREAIARLEATLAEQKKSAQKELAVAVKDAERLKGELEKQKEAARVLDEDRRGRATDAEKQRTRATDAEDALAEEKERARAALLAAEQRVAELEAALVVVTDAARDAAREAQESADQKGLEVKAAVELAAAAAEQAAHAAGQAAAHATQQAAGQAAAAEQSTTALRQALRQSVLPTLVDHVEAVAAGEATTTPAHTRQVTVLYLALADFDAYCDKAAGESGGADEVKGRLDRFCAAVAARVPANGGRIDQVTGHGHLIVFGADPQNVRAAVRCALEVAAIVDAEATPLAERATAGPSAALEPAVVAGIHTGTAVAGFFGGDDGVAYVEAGLPLVVARAAVDQAPPGKDGAPRGVVVSEPVRAVVAGDAGFRITRLGQTWIKGTGAPLHLALVELEEEGAA